MEVFGGCFCGELRYRADVNPDMVALCHCTDCQKLSGSAYRTVAAVAPEQFSFSAGEPCYFEKRGDSDGVRRMAFCGNCGSHICSLPVDGSAGGFVSLRLTTAEGVKELVPRAEIYTVSRLPWVSPIAEAMQFPRMPGDS